MRRPKISGPLRLTLWGVMLVAVGLVGFLSLSIPHAPAIPSGEAVPKASVVQMEIQSTLKSVALQVPPTAVILDQGVMPPPSATRIVIGLALSVRQGRLVRWWTLMASKSSTNALSLSLTVHHVLAGPSLGPVETLPAPPPGFHPANPPPRNLALQYQVWNFPQYRLVIATASRKAWAWEWDANQVPQSLLAPVVIHSN